MEKNSELVTLIKTWVDTAYEEGRVTALTGTEELIGVIEETTARLGITLGE